MDVIRLAFDNESFAFHGKHFDYPPPGIPDRGGTVQELTLVPRPLYPYEIWQAVTSPPTLEYVPVKGWGGVFWLKQHDRIAQEQWDRFGANYAAGARQRAPHRARSACSCSTCASRTRTSSVRGARPGHDEFWRFLGPYGWSRGYVDDDGKPSAPGLIPTLEQSVAQKVWIIGSPEEVAEQIAGYRDLLGARATSRSSPISSATRTRRPTSRWPASSKRSSPSCPDRT